MSHLHKLQTIEAAAMFVLLWIVYALMRIMQTEEMEHAEDFHPHSSKLIAQSKQRVKLLENAMRFSTRYWQDTAKISEIIEQALASKEPKC